MATEISEDIFIKLQQLYANDTKGFCDILSTFNHSTLNNSACNSSHLLGAEERAEYIRSRLGEQHLEFTTLIPLSFIYG